MENIFLGNPKKRIEKRKVGNAISLFKIHLE